MARKRKTKTELRQEWAQKEERAWELFEPRLAGLQSHVEALTLVAHAPPESSAGRGYYSNLGFFIQTFSPPAGASYAEKEHYIQLIERMDKAGELKPGVRETVQASLRESMKKQWS